MSRRRELLRRLELEEARAQRAALLVGGATLAWAFQVWALLGLSVAGLLIVLVGARRNLKGGPATDLVLAVVGSSLGALLGLSAGEPAPGLAAFLLAAQAGKLAAPAGPRDLGLAHVVGIVLLGVAAAEGVEPAFGFLLLVSAALTLQVAVRRTRTQLAREVLGAGSGFRSLGGSLPGALSPRALLGSGRNAALLALGTTLVFFTFPRLGPKLLPARRQSAERLSGFTDEVGLDDIGRIKQSDQLAFRVELPPGTELDPDGPYWRGTALDTYDGLTWRRSEAIRLPWNFEVVAAGTFRDQRLVRPEGEPVEAQVYQEPIGSRFLFAPGAVDEVGFKTAGPRYINRDAHGGMAINQAALVPLAYRVRCWPGTIAEPRLPTSARRLRERLCLDLPPRVNRELMARYVEDVRQRTRLPRNAPPSRLARALEAHLSRVCTYSAEGAPAGEREPVEEFLLHRRTGHCELFASALAVLLRVEGVPARLVTGFRGGDQNDWSGTWTVRQREAHAWVEALTERGWERLDATPADAAGPRSAIMETVQQMGDWLELRWFQYVIAFDAYDQRNVLFWLEDKLRTWLSGLGFPRVDLRAVLMGSLLPLVGLGVLVWLRLRARARAGGQAAIAPTPPALRRLMAALRRHGLAPARGETLLELARRARLELGAPAAALPDVVPEYYATRFGRRPLDGTAGRLEELAAALEALPPRG